MPHFNLRYFLETLGSLHGGNVSVLQVGAMDGRTFDPVHEFITRFGWKGVLVEPVKEHFAVLQETYKEHEGIVLVNAAVGEKDGHATMYRVTREDVKQQDMPRWGDGLASFYPDRNALTFDKVRPFIIEEEVGVMRLITLLEKYGLQRIDVLQIDAEGYDYHVLKQLDFERYSPLVINLEIVNLPKQEQAACKKLLDEKGYIHTKAGYDLLAVSLRFFRDLQSG